MAGLVHPAIVRYISHGVAENGARYIVMEWMDGEDLADKLDRELPSIDRDDRHRAPHRRGAGARARQGGRSPRHQARQPVPAGWRHRSPEGAGLRHRPADQRRAQADPHRVGDRDARLHGARAGSWRARHQAQRGRLLAGLRSVPVPDRARRCSRPRRSRRCWRRSCWSSRRACATSRRTFRRRSTTCWPGCWPRTPSSGSRTRSRCWRRWTAWRPPTTPGNGATGAPPARVRDRVADGQRTAHRVRGHRGPFSDGRKAVERAGGDARRGRHRRAPAAADGDGRGPGAPVRRADSSAARRVGGRVAARVRAGHRPGGARGALRAGHTQHPARRAAGGVDRARAVLDVVGGG